MIVSLSDSDGNELCFNHAVKAVMKDNENISINVTDDSDCGESGCWWVGICKKCNEMWEKENEK